MLGSCGKKDIKVDHKWIGFECNNFNQQKLNDMISNEEQYISKSIKDDYERFGYLSCKVLGVEKIKIRVKGANERYIDGPFERNENPVEFKEGQEYYLGEDDGLINIKWSKIRITYVRSGIIFYVKTRSPKKELWMTDDCLDIIRGRVQQTKYVIDTKKYPKKYYEWEKYCPFTKIIYK